MAATFRPILTKNLFKPGLDIRVKSLAWSYKSLYIVRFITTRKRVGQGHFRAEMRNYGKGATLILIYMYIKFNVSPVGIWKNLTITLSFWTLFFIGNPGVFLYILVWMWLCGKWYWKAQKYCRYFVKDLNIGTLRFKPWR